MMTSRTYHSLNLDIASFDSSNIIYILLPHRLPEEELSLEEIKKLYRMCWSEETSFRELKYTIGLTDALEEVVGQSYGLHENTCFNYIIF